MVRSAIGMQVGGVPSPASRVDIFGSDCAAIALEPETDENGGNLLFACEMSGLFEAIGLVENELWGRSFCLQHRNPEFGIPRSTQHYCFTNLRPPRQGVRRFRFLIYHSPFLNP